MQDLSRASHMMYLFKTHKEALSRIETGDNMNQLNLIIDNTEGAKIEKELTEEVIELFSDTEVSMHRVLRELATCFGPDATIHDVAVALADFSLPTRKVAGKEYIAGYKGSHIVPSGLHNATLIDLVQNGSNAKLLFAVHNNKYLFQTLETFRVEDIRDYTKKIGHQFDIVVTHEKIENTGDKHAVVMSSSALGDD